MRLKGVVFSKLLIFEVFRFFFWIFIDFYFNYFLPKIAKRGYLFHRPRRADVARMLTWHVGPTRMRRGTEATWQVTCRFRASLKHKDDGQKKFIKPNSLRQDIIIKYWVSIGSIHREQG